MKKGRHRRFEEARALKRSHEVDLEDLFETMNEESEQGEHKPEHDAWADLAEEWEQKSSDDDDADSNADKNANDNDVSDTKAVDTEASDSEISDEEAAS